MAGIKNICMSIVLALLFSINSAHATRIKDIANISGVRDNQLIGYGLIVGLDGTGDHTNQAPFTDQSFRNMLAQFGVNIPKDKDMQLKNVAAVALSATLPPFVRQGQKIDVNVSSIANAASLRGGTLLMSELRGADNQVYAMAQGSVVVSGFGARGSDGSKIAVNSTRSGRITNGATVEKTVDLPFMRNGQITFELFRPDFTTAERIAHAINKELHHNIARAVDAAAITVNLLRLPDKQAITADNQIRMIARLENIKVSPDEARAKVIVNSRTGTIVLGHDVRISPVAIIHGNLSVVVSENLSVSQPEALSHGVTAVTSKSDISIEQQKNRAFVFAPKPTLKNLVDAINRVGAAPGDLIAILEAIKAEGALHADLEVI